MTPAAPIDACGEEPLCYIEGDQDFPVSRGELNRVLKVVRRLYLLPIRDAIATDATAHAGILAKLTALDDTINDPKHGLEPMRWWIVRFAWGAVSLGAGLMAVGHFAKAMGWL
jgi:hypothetical protein